jgi:cytochrome c biogenesis factor
VVTKARLSPRSAVETSYLLLAAIVRHYLTHPPAAPFKLASSPLVMWLWIGAVVLFGGGLVAIWPAPGASRRVRARYLARVAQELGRA